MLFFVRIFFLFKRDNKFIKKKDLNIFYKYILFFFNFFFNLFGLYTCYEKYIK